jgi:hypothetical protein
MSDETLAAHLADQPIDCGVLFAGWAVALEEVFKNFDFCHLFLYSLSSERERRGIQARLVTVWVQERRPDPVRVAVRPTTATG